MKKSVLEPISIIGRFAFGASCFEKVCKDWGVRTSQIAEFIKLLWTFTSSNRLDLWEKDVLKYLPEDDDLISYDIKFGIGFLSHEQQLVMVDLILEIIELGRGNLYAGFKSEFTLVPILNIVALLENNNIILPNIEPFERSKADECHGWGRNVDKSFFMT